MSRLNPLTVWRRIALDERQPCKARLEALGQIARPPLSLLRRLLSDEKTPSRLRLAAARAYELEHARKELNEQNDARTDSRRSPLQC
jgi:hypothetical protein